jgi:uncharacterized repeat protein (TIGR02543 family)
MFEFIKRHKLYFIIVGIFLLLFLVATGALYFRYKSLHNNSDILAVVGSEKITQQDLNKAIYSLDFKGTIENPEAKNDEDLRKMFLNELIENSVIRQEAARRNVSVSDEEAQKKATENVEDYKYRNENEQSIIFDIAKAQLLKEKLKKSVVSYKNGEYVLVRFDGHLGNNYDEAKYQEDKKYADTLIEDLYKKISDKKISFKQAEEIILKDQKIGQKSFEDLGYSVDFYGQINQETLELGVGNVNDSDLSTLIKNTSAGQVNKGKLLVTSTPSDSAKAEKKDGIYAIVGIKDENKGLTNNFDSWLNELKIKYQKSNDSFWQYLLQLLLPNKAYALTDPGTCGGGLVESGSSNPAGFFVYFKMLSAGGGTYWAQDASVTISSSDTGSYTWGSSSYDCSSKGIVYTESAPDGHYSSHAFGVGSDGKVLSGGESDKNYGGYCGSQTSYVLVCSCKDNYNANFSWGGYYTNSSGNKAAMDGTGGHYSKLTYHFSGGSTSDYTSNLDPFAFSSVSNGTTQGMTIYFQINRPPVISYSSPPDGHVYTINDTVYLNTIATDADGDTVNHQIAYAKSTDGGATWGAWEYASSGLVAQSANARTITSFAANSKGAGYYKWVIMVTDEHGTTNAIPSGSPNAYSHNSPRYFTITNPTPTCSLTGGGTIYRGNSATLSWTTANATSTSSSWSTSTATSGSATVSPTSTTTYTLNVSGSGGSGTCSAVVNVQYCGDGTANGSEACDLGSGNGACPATCSSSCAVNANSYNLTYNQNTSDTVTGMPSNTTFQTNVAKTLGSAPTRTGYTFAGWNRGSDGLGTNHNAGSSVTFTECSAITLYAKWNINTYQITFNKNAADATGTMSNQSFSYNETKNLTANGFSRTGYTFAGWATTATGSVAYANQASYGPMGAANVTLFAKWTEYCLITCPTITSGATSTGPCSYNVELAGSPINMNVTGSVPKGTPTWSVATGTISPTTGSPVTYTTTTSPSITSIFLDSDDPNCRPNSAVVTASVKKCDISDITINPTELGLNSVETSVNPTFTPVLTNTLTTLTSRWRLKLGATELAKQGFASNLNASWNRVINALGNYTVTYEGLNGQSEFGTVPNTDDVDQLRPFGYCTLTKPFSVVPKAYCKIKSTSGDSPLILRVDAEDARTGSNSCTGIDCGNYIFKVDRTDGTNYTTVNVPFAPGLVNLTRTIETPGAYKVTVQRAIGASINPITECSTINSADGNIINVTRPGSGSGGEVKPN